MAGEVRGLVERKTLGDGCSIRPTAPRSVPLLRERRLHLVADLKSLHARSQRDHATGDPPPGENGGLACPDTCPR